MNLDMNKLFMLLLVLSTFLLSCGSDDPKDEFSKRQVTASELESGSGMYRQTFGSTTKV